MGLVLTFPSTIDIPRRSASYIQEWATAVYIASDIRPWNGADHPLECQAEREKIAVGINRTIQFDPDRKS